MSLKRFTLVSYLSKQSIQLTLKATCNDNDYDLRLLEQQG